MAKDTSKTLRAALTATAPVFFGYIFVGMAFGLLLQKAGYNALWAFGCSLTVYAGSMQFVLVELLTSWVGLAQTAVVTLAVQAVSYTHLDVYKRQPEDMLPDPPVGAEAGDQAGEGAADEQQVDEGHRQGGRQEEAERADDGQREQVARQAEQGEQQGVIQRLPGRQVDEREHGEEVERLSIIHI